MNKGNKFKDSTIKLGFEVYFQGEEDEKKARKELLPLIKKMWELGNRLRDYKAGVK